MFKNVAIIGDGGMGTVLGILLANKAVTTRIWGYDRRQLEEIAKNRENKKFLSSTLSMMIRGPYPMQT
jgi:glycerol-3-phosphate dehydrogenase